MLHIFGPSWPFLIQNGSQFIDLLIQRVRIEIRLYLEVVTAAPSEPAPSSSPTTNASKEMFISVCYEIVEHTISFLSDESEESWANKLSMDVMKRIHDAFLDVFSNVMCFIATSEQHTNFLERSVRVLGCWLAEETDALRDDLKNVMPALLSAIKTSSDTSLLELFLPAFREITVDSSTSGDFVDGGGCELVAKFVKEQCVSLVAQFLHSSEDGDGSFETVLHSLSVLLNLTWLEKNTKKRVSLECLALIPTLSASMRLIAQQRVPSLSHIRFFGHFTALAVSTLRHFSQNVVIFPDLSLEQSREILEEIAGYEKKFLDMAATVTEITAWEDLENLWVITVKAIAQCLPSYKSLFNLLKDYSITVPFRSTNAEVSSAIFMFNEKKQHAGASFVKT